MKLSIITVNKNNASGLEVTGFSVIFQTFNDFEWIVIDGGSEDNSIEVIKKYSHSIKYWVSEADDGIYNAMNKGILHATGDYCLFLNSGDWLFGPDSLKNAFNIIQNSKPADIYYGNCLTNDFFLTSEYLLWKMPDPLTADDLYAQTALSHQNSFIKRSLFHDHEFYNEDYPTVSDALFFAKEFLKHESKFIHINTVISVYSLDGISSTYKYAKEELHDLIKKLMNPLEYKKLVGRHNATRKVIFIKRIIKYILPYGVVELIKKWKKGKAQGKNGF